MLEKELDWLGLLEGRLNVWWGVGLKEVLMFGGAIRSLGIGMGSVWRGIPEHVLMLVLQRIKSIWYLLELMA